MMRGPDVACCAKARGDTAMPAPTAVNIPRKLRRWYIRSPHFDSLSPSEPSRLMICLIASGIRQQSTPRSVNGVTGFPLATLLRDIGAVKELLGTFLTF